MHCGSRVFAPRVGTGLACARRVRMLLCTRVDYAHGVADAAQLSLCADEVHQLVGEASPAPRAHAQVEEKRLVHALLREHLGPSRDAPARRRFKIADVKTKS